ncbi:Gfo/Idh/MocA family protein [Candidatus Latescibacterota bacterium]
MSSKIKAGVIGFGMAGRNMHYKALVDGLTDIVDVTAVWNRSDVPRGGRSDSDQPLDDAVAFYTDIDSFIAHPGVDVIHITTPSGQHLEFIERAAQAGKHVICDKPLEITLDRIDRAIEICKQHNVRLSVSFQHRFNPHLARVKKHIIQGALGEPVDGVADIKLYRHPEYYTESSWHGRYDLDGGAALMNQGIHYIDLLQWLMESPVAEVSRGVTDRLVHTYIEAEDFGVGELKLQNGASMSITGGTCFRPGFWQALEVRGTNGWVRVDDGVVTKAYWGGCNRLDVFGETSKVSYSTSSPMQALDNHIRMFRAFYEALASGGATPIDGTEARKSTEIVLGIYKASQTGQPVRFPYDTSYSPGKN